MVCAALVLLLAAGTDLLAIDYLLPAACGGTSSPLSPSDNSPDDDCFCCCLHVVPSVPVSLEPSALLCDTVFLPDTFLRSLHRFSVYHPPKA